MKSYILSIAAAAVISAVMEIITPAGWTKYVGIITGLTVVICIGQPILKVTNTNLLEGFEYNRSADESMGEAALYAQIEDELTERIERDAQADLRENFALDCMVSAELDMTTAGEMRGVARITLYGDKPDAVAKAHLRDKYGAEEVDYGGAEKNTPEPE